jgi:hypothetical protein
LTKKEKRKKKKEKRKRKRKKKKLTKNQSKKYKLIFLLFILFLSVTLRGRLRLRRRTMASINPQRKQQPKEQKQQPRWKWSGSDEPQSYYSREDDDGITLKTDTKWYDVKYPEYDEYPYGRDDDECDLHTSSAAPPPRISSLFWTTPLSIASGEEPMFEPEYPEYEEYTHVVPFMNLTKEQRAEKSKHFKFGLCCDCDYGLDDKSEFVCQPRRNGCATIYANTCNACYNYHMNLFEKGVGGEHGGCN